MSQSKQIIYFFLVLFLAGSVYLFAIDSRYTDPKYNSNWYALSFVDPKSDKLDFVIENFSSEEKFHWEILVSKKKVSEGDIEIRSGEKKMINSIEAMPGKKVTVRVSVGDVAQEIYKNIRN